MKRWGILMLAFGLGVFILPIVQPNLQVINSIGNMQPIAASVLAVIGAVLLTFSVMRSNSH